jgi:hypothetical protein
MHFFGHDHEPHLTHFEAVRDQEGGVILRWDVRNAPARRWRVLRSEHGFAETAEALSGGDQTLVSESADCGVRDDQAIGEATCYYAVFAQDEKGAWHRQVTIKIDHGDRLSWHRPSFEEASPADGYIADPAAVTAVELSMERQASNLLFAPPSGAVVVQAGSGLYTPSLRPKLDDD